MSLPYPDCTIWYVEASHADGSGKKSGSAVAVWLQKKGQPESRKKYLLTCGHVVRSNGGYGPILESISVWGPDGAYADGQRIKAHLAQQVRRVDVGEVQDNAAEDWIAIELDDPQASSAVDVASDWTSPAVGNHKVLGFPGGKDSFIKGKVIPVQGHQLRYRDSHRGVVRFNGTETRAGISGGGVFDEQNNLVGIHRARVDPVLECHAISISTILEHLGADGYEPVAVTHRLEQKEVAPNLSRKIIHLPYQSIGTLFKGREHFLVGLRKRLTESTAGVAAIASRPQTLFGAGGIGKTRTAIEYAWRNAEHYSALLFLAANSPEALVSSLANLSGVLEIDGIEGATDDVRLQSVLNWLQANPGWLAILDNVDDDAAARAVKMRLSAMYAGHVLITSRLSSWSGAVEKLELDLLSKEAASEYLLQATDQRIKRDDDHSQAETLGLKIGLLALGLEHAAAYINARAWSFSEYIQQWNQDEDSILAEFDLSQIDYPHELLVTWRLSVDRLDAEARALLEILSWLAPQPLSELTFDTLVTSDVVDVHAALNQLVKYSLLKREVLDGVRFYSQHQLVQATTRYHQRNSQIGESEIRVPRLESAIAWMSKAFTGSPQDVHNWPKLDPLVPHIFAVCEFANREEKVSAEHETALLLNQIGLLLLSKARLHEAEPLMRRALAIDEQSYGPDHPDVARDLNNLAQLLQATNRLAEAEPMMRRALAIDEETYGPEHPNVARDLDNLAQLLQATNRLAEAEPLMRRALAIDEQSYGPEHPNVARDINNLASLLQATNRLAEAEPLMRRALAIDEQSYGPDHPNVAIRLNNLASLLQDTNRLLEAEPLLRSALAIDEQSYGPDHPNVAIRLNNLAQLLQATNRLPEAEPLMRHALAIDEQSYGPEHPDVARDLINLALLLESTSRLAEAEPLMRRALAIDEQSYGPDHPDVATDLNNLASLLRATNRRAEAEPLMRRVVYIFEVSFGTDHPNVATALNNLAQLLKEANRLAEAEPLMRQVFLIFHNFTKSTGHSHPNTQAAVRNYCLLLAAMGKSESDIDQIIAGLLK